MAKHVLIFGAHPDDIESFCGGTAIRYAHMGWKVFFCVATNGNVGSTTLPKAEIAKVRYGEAKKAASIIGAELIWLGFDDEFLIDSVETRHAFINAMRIADPDVVICPCRTDYNPDHSITGYIVDECLHMAQVPNIETGTPITKKPIPHLYFMDTPAGVGFEPELYVDITDVFEKKVELLACHESQNSWMKTLFNYEMSAFLEIPARYRGLQAGVPMAEGFRPSYRWGRNFTRHYLPDCLSQAGQFR
ncbi:MAG: PIG-L family deacetylase [Sphaerochaetaceae bacterium]|nr:PIG-L family deacetylase [Sphaerochaetaceae bacterium]NLV84839.1 PIG-L family deacetylase [Spirochaetales bacterium]